MKKKPKKRSTKPASGKKAKRKPSRDSNASNDPQSDFIEVNVDSLKLRSSAKKTIFELDDLKVNLPDGVTLTPLPDPRAVDDGIVEPVYGPKERGSIQGNILPGFNKDHQQFLFFRIRGVAKTKKWLKWIAPRISSLDDVLAFVRAHRALRHRQGVREPCITACWGNIGFSNAAIAKLVSKSDAEAFGEIGYQQGLAERSEYIGDPTNPKHPGHRKHWRVGGSKNAADIVVIVAADEPHHLQLTRDEIVEKAVKSGLTLLFDQPCESLPGNLRGHEHFGFKDGISQPGVRGKVSNAPGDYITPRYIAQADPRHETFSKPGQVLLWPGQFLLGEPRQHPDHFTNSTPAPSPITYPKWAAKGSYLVVRRLLQDVPAFWRFANGAAAALGMTPDRFAAMLVGRWRSGAPIMRTPSADDPALATDEWANNHFLFDDNTRPSNLRPIPGYSGDTFSQAQADVLGTVCPHFSHIRKVNPRDAATDLGKAQDSMIRMILRRGIPFGPPLAGVKKPSKKLVEEERGLMFACYGATIEDQFEFLNRRWANSDIQPNSGGHDPIIGQADDRGNRERYIDFPTASGPRRVKLSTDWVIPSGGGYFFSPPIEAITDVLGA